MRRIYSLATQVILWTGEESEKIGQAFEIIEQLSTAYRHGRPEASEFLESAFGTIKLNDISEKLATMDKLERGFIMDRVLQMERFGSSSSLGAVSEAESTSPHAILEKIASIRWKLPVGAEYPSPENVIGNSTLQLPSWNECSCLFHFYSRPVFERVWIIQELCAARKIVVMCGCRQISWSKVARAATLLFHSSWRATLVEIIAAAESAGDTVLNLAGLSFIVMIGQWREVYHLSRKPRTLMDVLYVGLPFDSTDPRDKVFALLGLQTGDSEGERYYIPDYSKSVHEVFREITQWVITQSQSLAMLYMVHDCTHRHTSLLPSWVPDLTIRDARHNFNDGRFAAAGDSTMRVAFPADLDPDLMVTWAYRVDTITKISDEFSMPNIGAVFLHWSEIAAASAHEYREDICSAFWRTCVGHSLPYEGPLASADTFRSLRSFVIFNIVMECGDNVPSNEIITTTAGELQAYTKATGSKVNDDLKYMHTDIYSKWFEHTYHRRFYVTEGGFMGLCSPSVQPGDEVHLFSGGSAPFVLRPNDEVVVAGVCRGFTLMGDTYIHGLMHGEAMSRENFGWSNAYIL